MTNEGTPTGRTISDLIVETIKNHGLLYAAMAVCVLCLVIIYLMLIYVHDRAEPGSQISYLFGMVSFTKEKINLIGLTKSTEPQPKILSEPKPDNMKHYMFPIDDVLRQDEDIPLLDGGLFLNARGDSTIPNLILGGANIQLVHLAARFATGVPIRIIVRNNFAIMDARLSHVAIYIELKYKGNFFAIAIKPTGQYKEMSLSVQPIDNPTMILYPLKEIKDTD